MIPLSTTNNLSIKAVTDKGRTYVLAKCKSNRGNLEVAKIPAEYGMYWYPLPFYFGYHYLTNYKSILLKVDQKLAPRGVKSEFSDKNVFLHNFYDYKHERLGNNKDMYLTNLSITTKLKSMGLKTWDLFYNLQDVSYNYQLLSKTLDDTEQAIIERERTQGINPDLARNNPMRYATKEEAKLLTDIGMSYRMTNYMRKVANSKYQAIHIK